MTGAYTSNVILSIKPTPDIGGLKVTMDCISSNDTNRYDKSDQTILFVDDEKEILKALKRSLKSEPYKQYFVQSAKEALELMAHHTIHVLVSDMRMSPISGTELLEKVAPRYPETIRMVISGWVDADSILDAVNTGHIYRYIVKPWDARELKITLRQALEMYRLQAERKEMIQQLKAHNLQLEKKVIQRTEQVMAVTQQAEIGKFTSQIVHKLNDPLNNLSTTIELIGLSAAKEILYLEQLKKEVSSAQTEICQLKKIVRDLLGHTELRKSAHVDLININEIIKEEMDYFDLDPSFRYEIKKELRLADNLPMIMGNPIQIKEILDNLIKNAIDAMVSTSKKRLSIETFLKGNKIEIRVSDTGTGIPLENQDLVFLDSFTTKPMGKGTGLGLFIVKSTVAAYSGKVDFVSSPQNGTTFQISLPIGRSILSPLSRA
jgi:signal transduction histidine kinase